MSKSQPTILLVDCFAIAYQAAMSIGSGGEAVSAFLEEGDPFYGQYEMTDEEAVQAGVFLTKKEISSRLRKSLLTLFLLHKPTILFFCFDSKPYFRTEIMRDYYKKYGKVSANGEVLHYDNLFIPKGENRKSAYTVAQLKALNIEELGLREPTDEELEWFPKYKGTRKPFLLDGITKEDFGECVRETYASLATKVGGSLLAIPNLEADDLIAHICTYKKPETNVVIASVDSDLKQLIRNPNVSFFDTRISARITNKNADEEVMKLYTKLISGDTSDNISGIPKGNKGSYGGDSAKKMVDELVEFQGLGGAVATLEETFKDSHHFQRNKTLVILPSSAHGKAKTDLIEALIRGQVKKLPEHKADPVLLAKVWDLEVPLVRELLDETVLNQSLIKMTGKI